MDLFKFYMRNGTIVKCIGESASDAITRAGFGGGWLRLLDFYTEGLDGPTYFFNRETREWNKRINLRFTMAPADINEKIKRSDEAVFVIDRFDPSYVREMVGDLSKVGRIEFNDERGHAIYLNLYEGELLLHGDPMERGIKWFNYVGFAEFYYSFNVFEDYHYVSNGGWYFPLDSVQKAFEYWLNSAAKGMIFPDRKSHPEGSCSLDDIPTNYSI
jgi:hypothetical protein